MDDTEKLLLTPGADAVQLVPAGADRAGHSPLRGRVEQVSLKNGLSGWLVDRDAPWRRPALALSCGGVSLPCEAKRTHRRDIWETEDPSVAPGFRVPPSALLQLVAACHQVSEDEVIQVVAADSGALLPMMQPPTLGQLRKWVDDAVKARNLYADTEGVPLPLALYRHAQQHPAAASRASLTPSEDTFAGHIEQALPIDAHHVLLRGWTRRPVTREQAVILVSDGERHPGGLVMVCHERADLQDGARAFVAVLQSSWRPVSGAVAQTHLFLTKEPGAWLQGSKAQTPRTVTELRKPLLELARQIKDPRLDEIDALLTQAGHWQATPERQHEAGVRMALDHLYLVPGFGALVSGWLVSPGSRVAQVELRVGDTVLTGDTSTLQLRHRPDLAAPHPSLQDRLQHAGFCLVLRGPLGAADWSHPLIRLTLSDGQVLVLPVDAGMMRRLDGEFQIERLAPLYPALDSEPWLPSLANAWGQALATQLKAQLQLLQPVRSSRLLVLALPAHPADLTLTLDGLWRHVHRLPADVAVCLLFTAAHDRQRLMRWLKAVREAAGARNVGLAETASTAWPLQVLPALLHKTGARRFALLGPDLVLLDAGWQLLGRDDTWMAMGLSALQVAALDLGRPCTVQDAHAFVWDSPAFEAWARSAPVLFTAQGCTGGLPLAPLAPGGAAAPHHARRLARSQPSGFSARLNRALLDAAGLPVETRS